MLVEVEEGHHVGTLDPVEGGFGADDHDAPRPARRVGADAGGDPRRASVPVSRAASSSVARVTPIRSALQPGRVADRADRRAGLPAPADRTEAAALGLGHRATASGAAGEGAADRAGEEPDPPGPVEHTHHPSAAAFELGPGDGHEALGEEPGPRVVAGAVDHFDRRPPAALHRAVGGHQVRPLR